MIKNILLVLGLAFFSLGRLFAQDGSVDSLLPPDHILEDVPWMGDDGKIESKGLFSFEDLRAPDSKDLVLIYRSADAAEDLSKPHTQTLVVCFYNPTQRKYEKAYSEDGGQVQWVKVVADGVSKKSFLFMDRLDVNGQQVLSALAVLQNKVQPVLTAQNAQINAGFALGPKGLSVLCSGKGLPESEKDAEHVFKWNDAKSLFVEAPSTPAAGWTGSSVAGASPAVAAAVTATPVMMASPAPTVAVAAASPSPVVASAAPASASKDWWGDPFDAQAASAKLDGQIVPQAVKAGQMAVLGKKANAFFQKARAQGVGTADLAKMRAGYYLAVASTLSGMGRDKDAVYYLDLSMKLDPANADAVALKQKIKP
ncbi:MAG TPA: hypothetical protein VMU88_01295 [bacterium]|nr:hypothetical protein [bacterium]